MKKLLTAKFYISSLCLVLTALSIMLLAGAAHAETIGEVANRLNQSLRPVYTLIVALSLVSGAGFAIAAVFKFKQHKDNPTQIPVGTPIALIFVAAALVFMPSVIKVLGESLFEDPKMADSQLGGIEDEGGQ